MILGEVYHVFRIWYHRNMNILLADDEPYALKHLKRVVSEAVPDSHVKSVGTAEDAINAASENHPDVIFLDIQMPDRDGLSVAKEIRSISPDTNIIMVTAYKEYALDALNLFVSGYILKPADTEDVKRVMENLRYPKPAKHDGLYVRCFGNFEVFMDGVPVKFERNMAKEVFAYLIDRRGAAVSVGQICASIWEEANEKSPSYCRKLLKSLYDKLDELGYADVLSFGRGSYAVLTDKLPCDYYTLLRIGQAESHTGEYMNQYSWAEYTAGGLV